ncbi:MAG: dihydrolipoamide acetyltransferase family protein [Gammaproteobacteria bacterium]|jgi:pyruvate dehydrogenase E2 component (dihydrolipoamide acetyltransferase)
MKTFNLPDLGEGLPEAEIVTWHVKQGDEIALDQPMLSVETAKAVVEVPAPYSGRVARLHAAEGDIVETGKPLIDIDTGSGAGKPAAASAREHGAEESPAGGDSGTVVGSMPVSDEELVETAVAGSKRGRARGKVKAAPAVRALAKKLGVDLSEVNPTGRGDRVTREDVENFRPRPAARKRAPVHFPPGEPERLRGPRRAMAQSMSLSRDEVCACTIFDDADIHRWSPGQDITSRLLRAIVAGCRAEPALNGFYDGQNMTRQLEGRVDVAIAVDTADGLIVPVVRGVERKSNQELRDDLNAIKKKTRERTVAPEEMKDFTFTLSNFGMMAGRYATPVVVPPTIAILGAGGIRHDVVPVLGGIETHRRIPLSLSFDHRCATGGEACRFLAGVIEDLQRVD